MFPPDVSVWTSDPNPSRGLEPVKLFGFRFPFLAVREPVLPGGVEE